MFSSPTGELSFYQGYNYDDGDIYVEFSSPTGELSFYLYDEGFGHYSTLFVFVPYRGTKFLSRYATVLCRVWERVFVPYRGTKFLSSVLLTAWLLSTRVFVPYRGTKFLSSTC